MRDTPDFNEKASPREDKASDRAGARKRWSTPRVIHATSIAGDTALTKSFGSPETQSPAEHSS